VDNGKFKSMDLRLICISKLW